jgi:hypothetical protein
MSALGWSNRFLRPTPFWKLSVFISFIFSLFSDAVGVSNDRMLVHTKLEWIWKETVVVYFKVFWHLHERTEENHETFELEQSMSRPTFEPNIS